MPAMPETPPWVDGGNVVPEVVVVDAIDLPVHLVGARSVERTVAAACVSRIPRGQADHLGEVTTVQGKISDCLGIEHGSLHGACGIERDARCVDLDGGRRAGEWQRHRQRVDDAGGHRDLVRLHGLEAAEANGDAVASEWEILKEELAGTGTHAGMAHVGIGLYGDDGGVGNRRACLIGHRSVDASAKGLAECWSGKRKEKDEDSCNERWS